jgi:DMSO/TMAO reductase YedYZ heme-binding membrane subunit
MTSLLHRFVNGWPLFFLIAGLTVVAILIGLAVVGVATPEASVAMIRLSVQLVVPWIFLAFVTTALVQLFPGGLSQWLKRNRRYFGLAFAGGFGWQAVFIVVLLALYPAYYWEELHNATDLFLRLLSYVLLLALTVTSFFPVRRRMRPEHWRWLHLVGIWYFWAAIWLTYATQAFSSAAKPIDKLYFLLGAFVLCLRLSAHLDNYFRNVPERSESL